MLVELKKVTQGKYKKGHFIAEYPFSLTEVTRRIKAHCDKIRIFANSSQ